MQEQQNEKEELIRLLAEVACNGTERDRIGLYIRSGDFSSAKALLRRHRAGLLQEMHESQSRVDRLDFLVYRIDKLKNDRKE